MFELTDLLPAVEHWAYLTNSTDNTMSTSYWLYIHPELQGKKNYWKVGKCLTPYSAVRARQRFLVDDFYLTAVWFGVPGDVAQVESAIHAAYRPKYGAQLGSSRSELVYYDEDQAGESLISTIDTVIAIQGARLKRRPIKNPKGYHATNSGQCVFNCPQEKNAHEWSRQQIKTMFDIKYDSRDMFLQLFQV